MILLLDFWYKSFLNSIAELHLGAWTNFGFNLSSYEVGYFANSFSNGGFEMVSLCLYNLIEARFVIRIFSAWTKSLFLG
jgi:hypothetical protein